MKPKDHQLDLSFGTYIDNHNGGTVSVFNPVFNPPQQEESLGKNKSLRWTPTEEDDIEQGMKRDRYTKGFNPYVREITKITKHFSLEEINSLIENRALHRFVIEHKDSLVKLFGDVRKA